MLYEVVRDVGAYRTGQRYEWDLPPVVVLSAIRAGFIRSLPEPTEAPATIAPKKRGRPKKVVDFPDISGLVEADGASGL